MPDVYDLLLEAELNKAFDVWSGYLNARTGENPQVLARLRSLLESAREAAAEGDAASARGWVVDLYDEALDADLSWAPPWPRPCEADRQARDYVKDELPQALPLPQREELDGIALQLRVMARRLHAAPGLDTDARQDILYVSARAEMALDLAHPTAARHELERLSALARRWCVEL